MKQSFYFLIISLLFLAGCKDKNMDVKNNYDNVTTKYTKIKQIISKEVDDTFYVYVRLPKAYTENPDKKYPVLYLLDGDISFNMATSVVRYLQFGKSVPDLIIVAPGYGTMLSDKETNYRERDYTTSKVERFAKSGESKKYLAFLKNELIPMVQSSYRTNKKRILNGYSIGGLFAINTLLEEPDLFTDYIVGSPYLINDFDSLKMKIPAFYLNEEKRLFMSVGELEENEFYHTPINDVYNLIKNKRKLKSKFSVFEGGTHFTCPSEALTYGLKFVFSPTTIEEQD